MLVVVVLSSLTEHTTACVAGSTWKKPDLMSKPSTCTSARSVCRSWTSCSRTLVCEIYVCLDKFWGTELGLEGQ